ncbi:MAG: nucleotide pyrophosphohydrolase [Nitrospirae bacterium]|nr:nucleotide pyrophosphohydrolase [Nitrospirota bacterium]
MISSELKEKLLDFRKRRDWEKFHTPKDLAISLVLEASELLENFQWKSDSEISTSLTEMDREKISEEIADIAIYISYLCHDLNVSLEEIVTAKLAKNEKKYPVDKVRGSAKKYNEY